MSILERSSTSTTMGKGGANKIFNRSEREDCGSLSKFCSGVGQGPWICSRRVLHRGLYAHVCVKTLVVKSGLRQERVGNFPSKQSPGVIVQFDDGDCDVLADAVTPIFRCCHEGFSSNSCFQISWSTL